MEWTAQADGRTEAPSWISEFQAMKMVKLTEDLKKKKTKKQNKTTIE